MLKFNQNGLLTCQKWSTLICNYPVKEVLEMLSRMLRAILNHANV